MSTSPLLAALAASLSVLLLVIGFGLRSKAESVRQRLDIIMHNHPMLDDDELQQPLFERLLRPLLGKFATVVTRFAPDKTLDKLQRNIMRADMGDVFDGSTFMTLRLFAGLGFGLCMAVLALIMGVAPMQILLFMLGAGGLAYLLPTMWLSGKAKERQIVIRAALPDMLDMLTLCTGVMPLDRALARVAENSPQALRTELGRTLRELRAGVHMNDALQHLAEHVDIEELKILVSSINQSRQLGTPLAQVLNDQSADMRVRRRQRAETLAREAPIKMMFPLVMLVFPPLFIVLLGPAIPQIIHSVVPGMHL